MNKFLQNGQTLTEPSSLSHFSLVFFPSLMKPNLPKAYNSLPIDVSCTRASNESSGNCFLPSTLPQHALHRRLLHLLPSMKHWVADINHVPFLSDADMVSSQQNLFMLGHESFCQFLQKKVQMLIYIHFKQYFSVLKRGTCHFMHIVRWAILAMVD